MKVYPICQRYKFKSKSQHESLSKARDIWCIRYVKGTNLKANHNILFRMCVTHTVYPICQRYKFKSKSQPHRRHHTPGDDLRLNVGEKPHRCHLRRRLVASRSAYICRQPLPAGARPEPRLLAFRPCTRKQSRDSLLHH